MARPEVISREDAKQRGLRFYFSGETCARCHLSKRRVSNRSCIECDAGRVEKKREWGVKYRSRKEVRKVRAAYNKKWYAVRTWTEDQRSKARAAKAKWRKNNLEKAREMEREYAARRADKRREYNRKYSRKNAAKLAAKERNKRAIKLRNGGTHTKEDVAAIFRMQKEKCAYCRVPLKGPLKGKYHVDHIMPSAKGGSNGRENLQILCARCNHKKHARDPVEFAQSLGLLL